MNLDQYINYFRGAYHYRRATSCLRQTSKYITLKSANNILNITYTLIIS